MVLDARPQLLHQLRRIPYYATAIPRVEDHHLLSISDVDHGALPLAVVVRFGRCNEPSAFFWREDIIQDYGPEILVLWKVGLRKVDRRYDDLWPSLGEKIVRKDGWVVVGHLVDTFRTKGWFQGWGCVLENDRLDANEGTIKAMYFQARIPVQRIGSLNSFGI